MLSVFIACFSLIRYNCHKGTEHEELLIEMRKPP